MFRKTSPGLPLFTLGLISISVQVIFLREFLDVFYGNELIIGIILANWMLLSGGGALLAGLLPALQKKVQFTRLAYVLLGILPLLSVLAITLGRISFFPAGSVIGFLGIFLFSLVVQAPFCLVSGWLFPTLAASPRMKGDDKLSRAYLVESLGSFAGVLVFTMLLLFYLPSFHILFLLFTISLLQALFVEGIPAKKGIYLLYSGIWLMVLVMVLLSPQDALSRQFYQGQQIVVEKESPYGNLVLAKSAGQLTLYENGLPLYSADDPISREESVHFTLLQHPDPKRVLLISGGLSGQIEEILKYPVSSVDYLEFNPWILRLGLAQGLIPLDQRVHPIAADARMFLKNNSVQYDVILIQVPDPVTAQLNRYFTFEFFREIQNNLSRHAIVGLSLRGTADYMNPLSASVNSLIYNSLHYNFKHVRILAGTRNYFIATNGQIRTDLAQLATERGLDTRYVNADYIQDDLLEKRSQVIEDQINKKEGLNRDLHPRVYFYESRLWMRAFPTAWWIPFGLLFAGMVFFFARGKRQQISLFITGFTASTLSFILLMAFQSIYGNVYLMTGLLFSVFMLGLAAGCRFYGMLRSRESAPSLAWNQIFQGILAIGVLIILLSHKAITGNGDVLLGILLFLSALAGLVSGMQFTAMAMNAGDPPLSTASRLYSADLAGSATGMLLTAALLLPLGGPVWVCIGLGLVNFVAGFTMFE